MALSTVASPQIILKEKRNNYFFPLVLVTGLFLLWGLAYGLLDVLNKHFQETLHIDKARSTLLQMAYFGAYFLIALPAGIFMNRFGYKKGIITGLLLYTAGCFLFYPSAQSSSFNFFLFNHVTHSSLSLYPIRNILKSKYAIKEYHKLYLHITIKNSLN